jgi:hypothetical protein
MPLKIRCPHCHRVLVAEDAAAGEARPCPACGRAFSVPLPRSATVEPPKPVVTIMPHTCPRCRTEVAGAATFCHNCHTDLITGQRLPLRRRLRLLSWRFRVIAGLGLAILAVGAVAAIQLYRIRSSPASTDAIELNRGG